MKEETKPFQTHATDWRATLRQNESKTKMVIALFVLIYAALGFLLDIFLHGGFITNEYGSQFWIVFNSLIAFKVIPYATLTMAGVAAIALWVSFALYDRIMLLGTEYHEVSPGSFGSIEEQQLYNIIDELKIAAGIKYMPRVFIIEADYMNAFASGYSEKSAMVAITRGLMRKLDRSELQAVMAHELSHIRHGDIKLTLAASVLCNIMLIVVDILFYNVIYGRRSSDREEGGGQWIIVIVLLRYLLPVLTMFLMLFLSRTREYMADAGSVELLRDNHPLGRALLKINSDHADNEDKYSEEYAQTKHEDVRRAAYIFDPFSAGLHPAKSLTTLFSTHPLLDDRLKAIGFSEN